MTRAWPPIATVGDRAGTSRTGQGAPSADSGETVSGLRRMSGPPMREMNP